MLKRKKDKNRPNGKKALKVYMTDSKCSIPRIFIFVGCKF